MTPRGVSPDGWRLVLLSIGSHRGRRPLTPPEVGAELKHALEAGESPKTLADASHLDGITMINRFVRLTSLHEDVQHLVDWGAGSASAVPFSAASELARLDPHEQRAAFSAVLEHGLTSFEVRQLVQSRLRAGGSLDDALQRVIKSRPEKESRTLLIGLLSDDKTRDELAMMQQDERDAKFKELLDREFGADATQRVRLGTNRFSILLRPDGIARIAPPGSDFEQVISALLTKWVLQK